MNQFTEVKLDLIEEGQLLKDFDAELANIAQQIILHVQKHGNAAKGAKAKLSLELTLEVTSVEDETFGIASGIKKKLPERPRKSSLALASEKDGRQVLECRASGTSYDSPRQAHIPFSGPVDSESLED